MEEGGSTGWKIARGRRKREIWTSGDVGVERSEAIRMRFEFWVHLRICMCKHRCIPRQRYDLRVRAIIPSIQPVSRLFDETIPPESSLLNEKKKKEPIFPVVIRLSHTKRVTVDFGFGAQPGFSTSSLLLPPRIFQGFYYCANWSHCTLPDFDRYCN